MLSIIIIIYIRKQINKKNKNGKVKFCHFLNAVCGRIFICFDIASFYYIGKSKICA